MFSYGKFKLMNQDTKLLEIEEVIELDDFTAVSLIPDYYMILHGILKTISPDYQNDNTLFNRLSMVKNLYNELREISNNDQILNIKPLPESALDLICKIMNIQVLINDVIYGTFGQKVIIYNNYMLFANKKEELEEVEDIYHDNCPDIINNTFSQFLNKVIKLSI
jgi:hypothetical protein